MKKIYRFFKGFIISLQLLAALVYLYYWCINIQGMLFEISVSTLVVCSILNLCFFIYEKHN